MRSVAFEHPKAAQQEPLPAHRSRIQSAIDRCPPTRRAVARTVELGVFYLGHRRAPYCGDAYRSLLCGRTSRLPRRLARILDPDGLRIDKSMRAEV